MRHLQLIVAIFTVAACTSDFERGQQASSQAGGDDLVAEQYLSAVQRIVRLVGWERFATVAAQALKMSEQGSEIAEQVPFRERPLWMATEFWDAQWHREQQKWELAVSESRKVITAARGLDDAVHIDATVLQLARLWWLEPGIAVATWNLLNEQLSFSGGLITVSMQKEVIAVEAELLAVSSMWLFLEQREARREIDRTLRENPQRGSENADKTIALNRNRRLVGEVFEETMLAANTAVSELIKRVNQLSQLKPYRLNDTRQVEWGYGKVVVGKEDLSGEFRVGAGNLMHRGDASRLLENKLSSVSPLEDGAAACQQATVLWRDRVDDITLPGSHYIAASSAKCGAWLDGGPITTPFTLEHIFVPLGKTGCEFPGTWVREIVRTLHSADLSCYVASLQALLSALHQWFNKPLHSNEDSRLYPIQWGASQVNQCG